MLDAEAEDLRAALDRAAADRDAESRRDALRLAGGLTFFWYMRGRSLKAPHACGRRWR